jgi:hypothetical protein
VRAKATDQQQCDILATLRRDERDRRRRRSQARRCAQRRACQSLAASPRRTAREGRGRSENFGLVIRKIGLSRVSQAGLAQHAVYRAVDGAGCLPRRTGRMARCPWIQLSQPGHEQNRRTASIRVQPKTSAAELRATHDLRVMKPALAKSGSRPFCWNTVRSNPQGERPTLA